MIDILGHSSEFSHDDAVRLRRVEQKLDLVLKHLGIDYTETWNLSDGSASPGRSRGQDRGDQDPSGENGSRPGGGQVRRRSVSGQ